MPERTAATIQEAADDIATMRVRGAAALARHAVLALGRLAKEGGDEPALRAAGERLLATRPSAVSLRNAIRYTLAGLETGPPAVVARSERFVHDSLRARERVARVGAGLLKDASIVVTHCNSQAATAALEARHALAPLDMVIVLETRPWRQGLITARQLAEAGLPVQFMVDAAMGLAIDEADAVITGADTLAANGDVVNKVGTSLLSLVAHQANVPFFVAAESFKIDLGSPDGHAVVIEEREPTEVLDEPIEGVQVANPVFDVTPAARVTSIALEVGATAPADVRKVYEAAWV